MVLVMVKSLIGEGNKILSDFGESI